MLEKEGSVRVYNRAKEVPPWHGYRPDCPEVSFPHQQELEEQLSSLLKWYSTRLHLIGKRVPRTGVQVNTDMDSLQYFVLVLKRLGGGASPCPFELQSFNPDWRYLIT